jgi:DNA repair exonuclease SbcCD nuclease subunit
LTPLFNLNDIHIGVLRTGGTTPATAYQLRLNLLADFAGLLDMASHDDVIINGDWLDSAAIPLADLLQVYNFTAAWLALPHCPKLYAPAGNHDMTKNSAVLSSFDLLCSLLIERFPDQVFAIHEGTLIRDGIYVIPHMPNQDLFEMELSKIPAGVKYLFLHCNVGNNFAAKADHSLNLSLDQAQTLQVERIIVAHEHQRSTQLNGKVLVVGNQVPTSVADCLGNDAKYALRLSDNKVEWLPTWEREGSFAQVDWRELQSAGAPDFIRVIGKATAAEASEVVAAISNFRKISPALVITNAVEVEGTNDGEALQVSLEQIKSFSVMDELLNILNEKERATVVKLLEKNLV